MTQTLHTPILATDQVGVIYPGGTAALQGVSVEVASNDFLAILGPSGAGKSTLLRTLNRLGSPTSGRVLFQGRDVTNATGSGLRRLRQSVGMIFQQFNLVGRLTVLENVLSGRLRFCRGVGSFLGSHARWFSRHDKAVAMDALVRVGVDHLAHRRADALSGGQQQRVAIARLLAQEPAVILADEPIASLDPRSAEIVMRTLHDIHTTRKLPVVVNLHQVDIAKAYATRIVGMRSGRIVFAGTPSELDDRTAAELYRSAASQSDPDEVRLSAGAGYTPAPGTHATADTKPITNGVKS